LTYIIEEYIESNVLIPIIDKSSKQLLNIILSQGNGTSIDVLQQQVLLKRLEMSLLSKDQNGAAVTKDIRKLEQKIEEIKN
jgi:hypothetical protein